MLNRAVQHQIQRFLTRRDDPYCKTLCFSFPLENFSIIKVPKRNSELLTWQQNSVNTCSMLVFGINNSKSGLQINMHLSYFQLQLF